MRKPRVKRDFIPCCAQWNVLVDKVRAGIIQGSFRADGSSYFRVSSDATMTRDWAPDFAAAEKWVLDQFDAGNRVSHAPPHPLYALTPKDPNK